jgi:hypothetical protein
MIVRHGAESSASPVKVDCLLSVTREALGRVLKSRDRREGSEMAGAAEESFVQFRFEADVIYWRGPSPFFFVAVPAEHVAELRGVARAVTYGWGMVPVEARIGEVAFTTSLFPKDETYLLPLKAAVRRRADVTAGDRVAVEMTVQAVAR